MSVLTETDLTAAGLADLAARINAEHAAVESSFHAGLEHARRAGELLLQAKAQCQHGEWLSWLGQNVRIEARMAQKYMQIARDWNRLHVKNEFNSHLSIDNALSLLSDTVKPAPTAPAALLWGPGVVSTDDDEDDEDGEIDPPPGADDDDDELDALALDSLSPSEQQAVLAESSRRSEVAAAPHEKLEPNQQRQTKGLDHVDLARNRWENHERGEFGVKILDLAKDEGESWTCPGGSDRDAQLVRLALALLHRARSVIFPHPRGTIMADKIVEAIAEGEALR
jgi:hypothetical protein